MSTATVLLVGHCGPDAYMLRSAVRSALPDAQINMVDDDAALAAALDPADLVLVNRVLDGRFASTDGIGLIEALSANKSARFMLVSNFADAQARAEAVGALPGFGKADARSDETVRRIKAALAADS